MKTIGRFISRTEAGNGPIWQWLAIGDRVRPKRGRKRGTVVAIIGPCFGPGGVPEHVAVRWDGTPKWSGMEATDCLALVEEGRTVA